MILIEKSYVLKYNHSVKNYGRLCDRSYNEINSYHDQQFFKYHKRKIRELAKRYYKEQEDNRLVKKDKIKVEKSKPKKEEKV